VPLVAGARLPLAFIALGLAAVGGAAVWMALAPEVLVSAYLHPRVLGVVHLWLPGGLLSISIGAVYQLMPVVAAVPLRAREGTLWLHLALHGIGVPMIVGGFAHGRFALVGAGGALVAAGVLVLLVVVVRTFVASSRRDAVAWCFPLAAGWLSMAVVLGVLMGWNRVAAFLPLPAVSLLEAHAHLGLIGFFLTLLQGATFQLVPMFTLSALRRPRWVGAGLVGSQVGLALLAPGLAWGVGLLSIAGGAAVIAGIAASGVALVDTLRARRRRKLEPGVMAFVVGAIFLAVAAVLGGVVVSLAAVPAAVVMAYGVVVIPGALALMVLGMLCKIVPFLVWMRAYGAKVGREPVPVATSLASRQLEVAWLCGHVLVVVLAIGAYASGSLPVADAAAWLFLAALAVYFWNMFRVFKHLWSPAVPIAAVPAAQNR